MPLLNTLANIIDTSQIRTHYTKKSSLINSKFCTNTTQRLLVILLELAFLNSIDIPCSILKEHSHHTSVYSPYSYQLYLTINSKGSLYTNQIALLYRQNPFTLTEIYATHLIPPKTYWSTRPTNLRGTSVPTSEYPTFTHYCHLPIQLRKTPAHNRCP